MHESIRKGILVLGVSLILFAPALAGGLRTGFVATGFSSAAIRLECFPEICTDSSFEYDSDTEATCQVEGDGPAYCWGSVQTGQEMDRWVVSSLVHLVRGGRDVPPVSGAFRAEGERVSAETFHVDASMQFYALGESAGYQGGVFELSVFRYAGDPADLEGLQVGSVEQLVAAGLIGADDVLHVETFPFVFTQWIDRDFQFDVDVVDIPDEEIVLLVTEDGVVLIPALSGWGVPLLIALMLATATYVLRKRLAV